MTDSPTARTVLAIALLLGAVGVAGAVAVAGSAGDLSSSAQPGASAAGVSEAATAELPQSSSVGAPDSPDGAGRSPGSDPPESDPPESDPPESDPPESDPPETTNDADPTVVAPSLQSRLERAETTATLATADTGVQRSVDPQSPAAAETVDVVAVSDPESAAAVAAAIPALGGEVDTTYRGHVAAELPIQAVRALAAREDVRHVREPAEPVSMGRTSEGVDRLGADEVHDLGPTGENTTIAVIDVDFDLSNEKLADQVVATRDLRGGGFSDGSTGLHGTATAEVVADVAPDADLVLVRVGGAMDVVEAADWIETETDADVATMSLAWFPNAGPLDGTDVVSQRIEESTAEGLFWTVGAGNQGEYDASGTDAVDGTVGKHYDQAWTPHENDSDRMAFDVADERATALPLRSDGSGDIYVTWDANWTRDDQRYRVLLYGEDADGDRELVHQSNTSHPYEKLTVGPDRETLYLEIERLDADGDHHFDVFTHDDVFLDPAYTLSRSLLLPATSDATFTVGAVDQYDDRVAPYSSRGPTVDGRQGIDVVAPTNVSQLDSSNHRFSGTSASAPHVAGVAGLLLDANPALSVDEVRTVIEHSARDVSGDQATAGDDLSPDSIGSGHVDAAAAMRTGWLSGIVTDELTGTAVAGATVQIRAVGEAGGDDASNGETADVEVVRTTTTASDGTFETVLPEGTYELSVRAADFEDATIATVDVTGLEESVRNVSLDPTGGRVSVDVESNVTSDAIADATVALVGPENETVHSAETASDGAVVVGPVDRSEQYDLAVTHPDYEDGAASVDVASADALVDADVRLDPLAGSLEGTVYDGGPVDGAVLDVEGLNATATTDSDGSYEFSNVTSEVEHRLTATARAHHENASVRPWVAANETATYDVALQRRDRYLGVEALDAPATSAEGEQFEVEATIANLGSDRSTDDVELFVDGAVVATSSVDLNASATATVQFATAIEDAGNRTVSVATSNESRVGTIVIGSSDGASLGPLQNTGSDVSLLSASATESVVQPGDDAPVDVTLRNGGTDEASVELAVTANGTSVGERTLSIPPETTVDTTVFATLDEQGTYALAVDDEPAGSVVVRPDADGADEQAAGDGTGPVATPDEASSASTSGDAASDTVPGLGGLAALVALLSVAASLARGRG